MSSTVVWQKLSAATMDPRSDSPYGLVEDAAVVVQDDTISWVGRSADLPARFLKKPRIDGGGRLLTPALIDCHTHLVYGGNRASEFEMRLGGASYADIARAGGGILSTVQATRKADELALFAGAAERLERLLAEGVTGVEIKSGYGLDHDTELRMLNVARQLGRRYPIDVARTYLGAHAVPPEATSADAYIDWICQEMLPEIAERGLADAVDVFCEDIGFSAAQAERLFAAAAALSLQLKVHAEQLSNQGGAALAARYQALSADHLEYLDDEGIDAMARAGTVAVLLPGAFYFLRETRLPPLAKLLAAGVPIAIATDTNPGSSPVGSLLLMLNMACTLFAMTPEQAIAGVTRHAAQALGWHEHRGMLRAGMKAEMALWQVSAPAELAYGIGHNPCSAVVHRGEIVHRAGFQT